MSDPDVRRPGVKHALSRVSGLDRLVESYGENNSFADESAVDVERNGSSDSIRSRAAFTCLFAA